MGGGWVERELGETMEYGGITGMRWKPRAMETPSGMDEGDLVT